MLVRTSKLKKMMSDLNLDVLVHRWSRCSGLASEHLQDRALQIIVKMLERELNEPTYGDKFSDRESLVGYLYISTCRAVWEMNNRIQRHQALLEAEEMPADVCGRSSRDEVEGKLWASQLIEQTMLQALRPQVSQTQWEDYQMLLRLVLTQPQYISIRQSGNNKGAYHFRCTDIAQELGWSRVRVNKYCRVLRDVFLAHCVREGESNV